MEVFEVVIALLMVGAALSVVSNKIGAPYPALLALAGVALAFIPGLPTLELDPELALALFIAPVLLDSAFDASPRDLRANWKSVIGLVLGAVLFTVIIVALVAKWLIPDLPWAAAVALGGMVAPPDAAAATAVLKELKPPYRILVILEGESLFNDASALLIFRLGLAGTVAGVITGSNIIHTMIFGIFGSIILGLVLSKIVIVISKRIQDTPVQVVMQFGSTFAVWILAERLHLSGIITVVVFAISSAREVPKFLPARMRIPTWSVWEAAVFILNVLAFVLIGFQLKSIIGRTNQEVGLQYLVIASLVCLTVIVARIVWVFLAFNIRRLFSRRTDRTREESDVSRVTAKGATVVAWAGMRGTVTLAAALALPASFPHRDIILASAFGVTLGTLIVQGLTLRPLLLWLNLKDDGMVEREVGQARIETLQIALKVLAETPETPVGKMIKESFEWQLGRAQRGYSQQLHAEPGPPKEKPIHHENDNENAIFEEAIRHQRKALVQLREKGSISDAAFQKVEEELDWMELGWQQILHQGEI